MKSISFDNPYWLLIAIPLVIALLVPYFISVTKDNKTKGWIASLVIHFVIIAAVALAAAGLAHTTVMTRTKVYVVADVSYSSERNLDLIDEYIQNVKDALPQNSRLGIVCFGRDYEILTSSGEAIRSVKESTVDKSATDIAAALDATSTFFSTDEIKRIVLITDGYETTGDGKAVSAVERLIANDIKLDVIYLDNNLKEGERELQLSDIEYTEATYLDRESTLKVLVESNSDEEVRLDLYRKEESGAYKKLDTTVAAVEKGLNIHTFPLPTDTAGSFEYKVELTCSADVSPHNNSFSFIQSVAEKRNVLLVTDNRTDVTVFSNMYAETANLDAYIASYSGGKPAKYVNGSFVTYLTDKTNPQNRTPVEIPYTIELLSQYDEIILSNVDIRNINNVHAFVDSIDIAVSQYGKSLITMGDLKMQNKTDEIFAKLEELLPVNYGNANADAKLYTIVLDVSRSMNDMSQLIIAKDAATKLISLLDNKDYVSLVTFSGEVRVDLLPTRLGDCREELYSMIQNAAPAQGTYIGAALKSAYDNMRLLPFEKKQIMLISDGLSFTYEREDAATIAESCKENGIVVSTVNVLSHTVPEACTRLSSIAEYGGGNYYVIDSEEKVADLIFATVADEMTESIIEGDIPVTVKSYREGIMEGFMSFPNVGGYVNTGAKLDATTVLAVDYKKNEKTTVEVPLYAYRHHGNGTIATFTSSVSAGWLNEWTFDFREQFFHNLLMSNTPDTRINYPYNLTVEHDGNIATVEISPSILNPRAKAKMTVKLPDGRVIEQNLLFDQNRYFYSFEANALGRYDVNIVYSYGDKSFEADSSFNVSYYEEYNAFVSHDPAAVHSFVRGSGAVTTDGSVNLENKKGEVDTYKYNFRIPLLILAVVLFIADIIVRKLKWAEVQTFFAKLGKRGHAK